MRSHQAKRLSPRNNSLNSNAGGKIGPENPTPVHELRFMNTNQSPQSATIVGSGIVGIACAHYLSEAGLDVTVIDRGTIAGECSHANCGYICPSHALPLTEPGAFSVTLKSIFNPRHSASNHKSVRRFGNGCSNSPNVALTEKCWPRANHCTQSWKHR